MASIRDSILVRLRVIQVARLPDVVLPKNSYLVVESKSGSQWPSCPLTMSDSCCRAVASFAAVEKTDRQPCYRFKTRTMSDKHVTRERSQKLVYAVKTMEAKNVAGSCPSGCLLKQQVRVLHRDAFYQSSALPLVTTVICQVPSVSFIGNTPKCRVVPTLVRPEMHKRQRSAHRQR